MNRNDRAIVGVVTVAHAMVHTYELSIPVLVPVWLSAFGVTPFVLSLVVSVGYALFGLGALPAGVLADAIRVRTLIVGCLVGMGLSFLALSVAPGPVTVALALLVWGAAASVYHPSGLSLISRGARERGTAFAYHGVAGNLGIALGPLATLLLLLVFDWRIAVALLAIPAGAAAVLALSVDIDERAAVRAANGGDGSDRGRTDAADAANTADATDTTDAAEAGRDVGVRSLAEFLSASRTLLASAFLAVFGVVMLSGLFYRGTLTFLPELLRDVPALAPVTVGGRTYPPGDYLYVGLLMVGVAGQFTGGKLTDRIPTEYGLLCGFAALSVLAVLFVPAADAGVVALAAVAAGIGFFLFLVQPFYQATVAEYTPADVRGLSYGYTYLGTFGVGALGAVLAGSLLTYFSAGTLFLALAGLALAAATVAGWLAVRAR